MFSAHFSQRLAGAGAVAIVGLGGALVGGVSPAQAAGVDTSYTCETIQGPATSAVKIKLSLPDTAKAGSTVKARKFKMDIVLPEATVGTLNFFGIKSLSGDVTKLSYKVGKTAVAVTGAKFPETAVPATGAMTLKVKGTSAAFTAPAVGTHTVKVPKKYTMTLKNDGAPLDTPKCVLDKGAESKLGSLETTKNRQGTLGLRP